MGIAYVDVKRAHILKFKQLDPAFDNYNDQQKILIIVYIENFYL